MNSNSSNKQYTDINIPNNSNKFLKKIYYNI